ncbi:pyroglutamyl-peptidase I [Pseudarthrobacter sp. N5]|uniref:pyroglutamyl-peptidase I n=1 Tax=Pseudarthrobacter sp. N5 TaxID=3418416 RepID=UPI003CEC4FBD
MILLTGFEPFGGGTTNPSWTAVTQARTLLESDGLAVAAVELPCVFGESASVLRGALDEFRPELAICVGQAGGRERISLERVAINCDDARIPDNAGKQPVDAEVVAGGPAAYFSSLPIKAALHAINVAGIPAEVSQTAGTYVCNHIFYTLMHQLHSRPGARGGFIHVPFEPSQLPQGRSTPAMRVELMAQALAVVVRTALVTTVDIRMAAGATH